MKRKHKHNAKKTKVTFQHKEYEFPSKAEAHHFLKLAQRVKDFEIDDLSLQPEFEISDRFVVNTNKTLRGKSTVSAMKYTPDFQYYKDGKKVVVETKGHKTTDYVMRMKLFIYLAYEKYNVDYFIEVINGKETRYDCRSVKHG